MGGLFEDFMLRGCQKCGDIIGSILVFPIAAETLVELEKRCQEARSPF